MLTSRCPRRLTDADTPSVAAPAYEALRDGTATALRIHATDADGVSRAAFLDTVEAGDLFEWREAGDCFVRYRVTSMAAASGTSTREFGVKSFTDAYAGCSGVVAVEGDRRIDWSPPVISSRALTSPVRHGLYHLIPSSWAGTTAEPVFPPLPDHVAAIRDLPCCDEPHPWWREAEVPEGWTLVGVTWGGETDPTYGYSAWYGTNTGKRASRFSWGTGRVSSTRGRSPSGPTRLLCASLASSTATMRSCSTAPPG